MNESILAQPLSRRRFVQFRLRSLLLLPVLVALVGYWYVRHCSANIAREAYRSVSMAFQEGSATAVDVCEASLRLCEAEEQVPLASSDRARAFHLARVVDLELNVRANMETSLYGEGGREAAREELGCIVEYRMEASHALGER